MREKISNTEDDDKDSDGDNINISKNLRDNYFCTLPDDTRLDIGMMAGVLGRGFSQTRCPDVSSDAHFSCDRVQAHSSESPEENRVPLHDESQDQDGGGCLFESKWKLGEDLGIGYIIRFDIKDPSPDHQIEVDDVFVDLDEAVKLLSCVSKGSKVTIKPPKIQSIWTIRIEDEERDFCPLTEFVYHAALKATGKKFRRVYNGILSSIISNLYRSREYENPNRPVLKSYSEKKKGMRTVIKGKMMTS